MLGLETWGLDVVLWVESWRTPLIESFALFFHEAGQFLPYFVMLPIAFWCVDRRFGISQMLWFSLGGAYLNLAAKALAGLPRPHEISSAVHPLAEDIPGGFPSGHAQLAILFWGLIAMRSRKRWVWIFAIVYSFLIGVSRVVVGLHFPQDVLGGWVLGIIVLALYARTDDRLTAWLSAWPAWGQVAAGFAVGAVVAITVPDELGGTIGGALVGFAVGLALANSGSRASTDGPAWQRVVRYLLGIVVALGLRASLDKLFESLDPALLWRMLRYAVVGFWFVLGAPWAFIKAKLAQPLDAGAQAIANDHT